MDPQVREEFLIGKKLLEEQSYSEAESIFRRLTENSGFDVIFVIFVAKALRAQNCDAEAANWLRTGLVAHPESKRLHAALGDLSNFTVAPDMPAAIAEYSAALVAKDDDLETRENEDFIRDNLAVCLMRNGESLKALRILYDLVQRHPENERFKKHLLMIEQEVGFTELNPATKIVRDLFVKQPCNPEVRVLFARLLFRLLRHDEALSLLEEGMRMHPGSDDTASALGGFYERLNRKADAKKLYMNALETNPEHRDILHNLGLLEWGEGNHERAAEYFAAIREMPSSWLERYVAAAAKVEKYALVELVTKSDLAKDYYNIHKDNPVARKNHFYEAEYDQRHENGDNSQLIGALRFVNNSIGYADYQSKWINYTNGQRFVVNVPQVYSKTVYLLGRCGLSDGGGDGETLASRIQEIFNREVDTPVRVVNAGATVASSYNQFLKLSQFDMHKGDMVVVLLQDFGVNPEEVVCYAAMRDRLALLGICYFVFLCPNLARVKNPSTREKTMIAMLCGDGERRLDGFVDALLLQNIPYVSLDHVFDRPHGLGEVFTRDCIHFKVRSHIPLAEKVVDVIRNAIDLPQTHCSFDDAVRNWDEIKQKAVQWLGKQGVAQYSHNSGLASWIGQVRNDRLSNREVVGAIIMNCNPFTKGHLHLIETAANMVDGLYIFVVQEDKSEFPFADRLRLVKEGTEHLGDKVAVVPSGEFVISSFSFPGYFTKQNAVLDMDSTSDLVIFGALIAPALNIRHRFVGEEPSCAVTRSYNERMLYLLPDMGVDIHVFPRKEERGSVISASLVRKALEENDVTAIRALVPQVTFDYLLSSGRLKA